MANLLLHKSIYGRREIQKSFETWLARYVPKASVKSEWKVFAKTLEAVSSKVEARIVMSNPRKTNSGKKAHSPLSEKETR